MCCMPPVYIATWWPKHRCLYTTSALHNTRDVRLITTHSMSMDILPIFCVPALAKWSCWPRFCMSYAFQPLFCAVASNESQDEIQPILTK